MEITMMDFSPQIPVKLKLEKSIPQSILFLLVCINQLNLHSKSKDIEGWLCRYAGPTPFGRDIQVHFKPSNLGFKTIDDQPIPVYIQQHLLIRLDERLGLPTDVMHGHLFYWLYSGDISYKNEKDHSLITFNIHGIKVGYLLVTLHDNILLVRSFLFLTNDGTAEGKKLRELTKLEKYDKKYLGIDKLSTFNAYHIDQDGELSELFREAGCGSLLEAGFLETISTAYTPKRDPNELRKYLNQK